MLSLSNAVLTMQREKRNVEPRKRGMLLAIWEQRQGASQAFRTA